MRTETLAREIRKKSEEYTRTQTILSAELKALKFQCIHSHVIITALEYARSYDYDNWHPETRMCIVCGATESGAKTNGTDSYTTFTFLLNPKWRVSWENNQDNWALNFTEPLSKVITYLNKRAYKV